MLRTDQCFDVVEMSHHVIYVCTARTPSLDETIRTLNLFLLSDRILNLPRNKSDANHTSIGLDHLKNIVGNVSVNIRYSTHRRVTENHRGFGNRKGVSMKLNHILATTTFKDKSLLPIEVNSSRNIIFHKKLQFNLLIKRTRHVLSVNF